MCPRNCLPTHIDPSLSLQYLSSLEGVETASVMWSDGTLKAFLVVGAGIHYGEGQLKGEIADLFGLQNTPREISFAGSLALVRAA